MARVISRLPSEVQRGRTKGGSVASSSFTAETKPGSFPVGAALGTLALPGSDRIDPVAQSVRASLNVIVKVGGLESIGPKWRSSRREDFPVLVRDGRCPE